MSRVAADAVSIGSSFAYRRRSPAAGWASPAAAVAAGLRWVAGTAAFAGIVYTIAALPGLMD